MRQSYSRGRFELFIVATVIALIALVALDRYTLIAKKTRILRLEIISHHFMIAAANFRSEILISEALKLPADLNKGFVKKGLSIDGKLLYASPQGWPASLSAVSEDFHPTDEDCYQLWQLLLQNPPNITFGEFTADTRQYHAFARADACRYLSVSDKAYFDYFPLSGRLLFSAINDESFKH